MLQDDIKKIINQQKQADKEYKMKLKEIKIMKSQIISDLISLLGLLIIIATNNIFTLNLICLHICAFFTVMHIIGSIINKGKNTLTEKNDGQITIKWNVFFKSFHIFSYISILFLILSFFIK